MSASRWLWAGVLLVASFVCILVHLECQVIPEDDAFIAYRYADHLATGAGPYYNEGERVFGATSPLYVLWLAGLRTLFPDVPTPVLSVRGNLVFYLTSAALLWVGTLALSRRSTWGATSGLSMGPHWAGAATLSFLLMPDLLRASTLGMETFLFVTWMLGSLTAMAIDRPRTAFALAGLASVTRPEGLLLVVPLVLAAREVPNGRGARLVQGGLVLAVPLAVWVLAATWLFGSPIPHSVVAKSAPLYPLPPGDALRAIADHLAFWAARGWPEGAGAGAFALRVGVALAWNGLAIVGLWLTGRPITRCPGVILGTLVVFYALTNPLFFEWYWPPMEVCWLLVVVMGAVGWARSWSERRTASRAVVVVFILMGWVVVSMGLAWRPLIEAARGGGRSVDVEFLASLGRSRETASLRVHAYREAARWINLHAPAGSRVLAAEIGALGYYTPARIIDAAGLVTPEAVPYLPVPSERRIAPEVGAIPRGLITDTSPDYVVTLPVFAARSLLDWPWFLEHYDRVHEVDLGRSPAAQLWGSRSVLIFRRVY